MLASLRCCKTFSSTKLNSTLILFYNFSLLKSGNRFDTGSTWIGIYIFTIILSICWLLQSSLRGTETTKEVWLPWWLRWYRICLQRRRPSSIPGSERSPGEGKGYPLQYSCLENPLDRGAWQAAVRGVTESRTGLSN